MVLRHEFPTDIFKRNHFDFYSTYLLCLLRNHQYDEAKYLWKRSPEQFKQSNNNHTYHAPSTPSSSSSSSTLFAWTWELGKLFFTQQRAKAIQYIQSALATSSSSFPENILVLLQDLLDYHLQLFFFQLQNAYQPLVISKVAQHLETTEDAVNQCKNLFSVPPFLSSIDMFYVVYFRFIEVWLSVERARRSNK